MSVTRNTADGQRAGDAAAEHDGLESSGSRAAMRIAESSINKRKRANLDNEEVASESVAASNAPQPSPYMLPIELLVDTFLYLNTSDIARSAQVNTIWNAASKDVHLWRHLSSAKRSSARTSASSWSGTSSSCASTSSSSVQDAATLSRA